MEIDFARAHEGHPLQGQSPYSASKIGADKLAESFFCAYGLPVVTVRPFNTFGPRQSARAVIPTVITQALALDRIELGSLSTTRDFTFVSDTVRGFLRAGEAEGVEGQVFNLGTGEEISIGDLACKIIHLVGRPVEVGLDEARLRPEGSEVLRLLSDNSLARQSLGWQPEVSLDDGLGLTIAWIREHLDQRRRPSSGRRRRRAPHRAAEQRVEHLHLVRRGEARRYAALAVAVAL